MFITRKIEQEIRFALEDFPVLTLTGPRQSGKTTLCQKIFPEWHYVNLEAPDTRKLVADDPRNFLKTHANGLIIDEAQRLPELFSFVQVLVDEDRSRRFVLSGSSNFALMSRVSQSLAGRTAVLSLLPLALSELSEELRSAPTPELMLKGGYPDVWANGRNPEKFYSAYFATYVERDLRNLLNVQNLSTYEDFMRLCAGSVGTTLNLTNLSNSLGVSRNAVQEWFSTLETSYLAFRLPPYFSNIRKRITKTPKIYFYDTGFACWLLGIETAEQLVSHPLRGQLFENLIVSEFFKNRIHAGKRPNFFFYRDNLQKEIDIVEDNAGKLSAYEIKSAAGVHDDFFKSLDYFRKLFGENVVSTKIIYDGEIELDKPEHGVINFRHL